jgi:hypothetical protein
LTELNILGNSIKNKNSIIKIRKKLMINCVNKKRSRCLQILCLEKLKQFNRIDEIKLFNPVVYDSCIRKY